MAKSTFVPCKGCHEMVEVPLPEPEKVTVTEPCKCGLTENARMTRYWTTALPFAVLFICTAIVAGTTLSNKGELEQSRVLIEEAKAETNRHKVEAQRYFSELERYKAVLGELKAAAPTVAEKFAQPEKK